MRQFANTTLEHKIAVVTGASRGAGRGVTVLGVAPGWMRTEALLEDVRQGKLAQTELEQTELTEYIGRTILALATDPDVMTKCGQILRTRDLAREYGFTDTDGRQPS